MPLVQFDINMHAMGLIDVDATVFVQLGIFLIFFIAMNFLIFKPMVRLFKRRYEMTEGKMIVAHEKREEADEMKASYETRFRALIVEASKERGVLRGEAKEAERDIISKARKDAGALLTAGMENVALEFQESSSALAPEAAILAERIVSKASGAK